MKVIDISGPIYNDMWYYEGYTRINIKRRTGKFHDDEYTTDEYEGMNEHTGTYMETPGMWVRHSDVSLDKISLDRIFMVDAYVLQVSLEGLEEFGGRPRIPLSSIKAAEKEEIPDGGTVIISTGYGTKNWDNAEDFVKKSWYFKADAFDYFVDKKLNLVGGDSPSWENYNYSEGNFNKFYDAGILLLAPLVNLEKINNYKVKLCVLPLNIPSAKVVPVRAVVIEE